MIRMEVDLHSPSFRALRSFSSKRARSPESPPSRPSKRLSLALDHPRFAHTHTSGYATPQSPASSSRFPSEDWVHQADGLTIDSPVITGSGLAEDRDEDINMDPDETNTTDRAQQQQHTQRPVLPPIQTMSFAHAALYRPQQRPQLHQQGALLSAPTPAGPLVTVLPPTPIPPSSTSYLETPHTRPSTPPAQSSGSSAMASFAAGVTSPRKQRFTMGPRADCVKCQMGVKGHSVHY
ncbi:hypothetical protein D9615_001889 [Tricholomella constricta]|uniref:Uncharacterized protein n=1 Tax=Tricholomella constricta TaxID=117010 RepID=A0A8H5HP86_9AGAR|nr:hypothetical protein D9615_001889 [Tricholomella constricta]